MKTLLFFLSVALCSCDDTIDARKQAKVEAEERARQDVANARASEAKESKAENDRKWAAMGSTINKLRKEIEGAEKALAREIAEMREMPPGGELEYAKRNIADLENALAADRKNLRAAMERAGK